MKKLIAVSALFIICAICIMCLFACGNDDKKTPDASSAETSSQSSITSASEDTSSSVEHTHTLTEKFDAEGHWQECDCGYKTEKTAHTLVCAYDAEGHWEECECGYKTQKTAHTLEEDVCTVCGYEKTEITYSFTGDESALPLFAQGTLTLTTKRDLGSGKKVSLFWGNADGVFDGFLPFATATTESGKTLTFTVEENVAVLQNADRVIAYIEDGDGEKLLGEYMLPDEKKNDENVVHKFASISDVHCNYVQGQKYWANALKEFAAAGVEFIINSQKEPKCSSRKSKATSSGLNRSKTSTTRSSKELTSLNRKSKT